mmetsp:Transcript_14254/g.27218  ORF Transcript_14254/g.27218 Transcript_14254/m.27218 type:complete len:458 (+) Transcript_14254:63-1436(+)
MASKEETTAEEKPASTSEAKAPAPADAAPTAEEGGESKEAAAPAAVQTEAAPAAAEAKKAPESDSSDRSRRVYVGNLAWEVSWQDLKDHMKSTGLDVIRATVLTTADGRSKGCGLAEFATADDAAEAVKTLTDTELMGRQIFVREDREERSAGVLRGEVKLAQRSFSTGQDAKNRRVYVGNLSWDVAWQDLKDHMRQAGEVLHAEVITEYNGRSKGCGIVEFATEEAALEAISTLTDTELKGRMIFVREDRESSQGPHGVANLSRLQNTGVYVWNLAPETSWQDLKDHMRKAGNVDSATILTNAQGESVGCGVVVYQKPQEAARAIRELQNSELNGMPLFAREDRERHPRGGLTRGRGPRAGGGGRFGGNRGGGGRGAGSPDSQVYVGNLAPETNWRDLKDHFRQCGDVRRAEVVPSGGSGTVSFSSKADADAAIQRLNGSALQGRTLEVRRHQKPR